MQHRSTAPDSFVVFFPYNQEQTDIGQAFNSDLLEVKPIIVQRDIISVSTSKGKGGAGSWRVTLASGQNYKSILHAGAWAMIYISDSQLTTKETSTLDSGLKMVGFIRSIRTIESTDAGSGIKQVRYDIAGDDWHSIMTNELYIAPFLRSNDETSNAIVSIINLFKETTISQLRPDQMIKGLVNGVLGAKSDISSVVNANSAVAGGIYAIPDEVSTRITGAPADGQKFVSILKQFLQNNLIGTVPVQPETTSSYNLWGLIQTYAHRIINEVYTDLMPANVDGEQRLIPSIVLRSIPFSSNTSSVTTLDGGTTDAPTLAISDADFLLSSSDGQNAIADGGSQLYVSASITEDMIYSMNYGKSDAERFNFFFIPSTQAMQAQADGLQIDKLLNHKNGFSAISNTNSLLRYGFRPFIQPSIYALYDNKTFSDINAIARDIWGTAYLYENGQVSIIGSKDYISVGTNIIFADRNWIAHVESVSHSFTVGDGGTKTFRTSIAFVRLQTIDGQPIDLVENQVNVHDYDRIVTINNKNNGRDTE